MLMQIGLCTFYFFHICNTFFINACKNRCFIIIFFGYLYFEYFLKFISLFLTYSRRLYDIYVAWLKHDSVIY
jgi:hypothetical protein